MPFDWLKSFRGRTRRRISNHFGFHVDRLENITLLSPTPVGPKYRVNTYTTGDQAGAAVAMDDEGNYIVVWESNGHPGLTLGVFAQRYNSAGEPIGTEFQVDTPPLSNQSPPALISFIDVAMDPDGDFVVVWKNQISKGLMFRRFNSEGIAQGPEVRANPSPDSDPGFMRVEMDPDGDFVIAWNEFGESYASTEPAFADIAARCYTSDGSPKGNTFLVHPPVDGIQNLGEIAVDEQGNFAVVWQQDFFVDSTPHFDVRGRRFDSSGTPLDDEFLVASTGENEAFDFPSVSMAPNGDFVVTWNVELSNNVSTYAINAYARLYSADGSPKGTSFSIKSSGSEYYGPIVTATDDAGNFVAIWTENFADIRGQTFDPSGNPVGSEFLVSETLILKQDYPLIAMAPRGNFVAVWRSTDFNGDGVFSQRMQAAHESNLAVWRSSRFYLDSNHSDTWNGSTIDTLNTFGSSTDTPIAGDWNGDGYT
ncbi:MAG: hypothetical protein KDA68_14980, partial [Planctomycetaceae bacterium]|nr:hypothetical protein [Planctomycetaceae bacterium]